MSSRANRVNPAYQHRLWVQQTLFQDPNFHRAADAVNKSKVLKAPTTPITPDDPPKTKTVIRLVENYTFSVARQLHLDNPNDKIAVLNMANQRTAGGGWLAGGRAQEEDLCNCSTLYETLNPRYYALDDDEMIYSPDVLVVKDRNPPNTGGTFLTQGQFFYVDVVSCPAVCRPALTQISRLDNDSNVVSEETYRDDGERQLMRNKIRWILNAALQNGVQRLVLGALGCGVFHNPIREVARMMKSILIGDDRGNGAPVDYGSYGLLEIVIAIFDPSTGQSVLNGFKAEFREGRSVHITDGHPVPTFVQYTTFPKGYIAHDDHVVASHRSVSPAASR